MANVDESVRKSVDNFSLESRLGEQRQRGEALQIRIFTTAGLNQEDVAERAGFRDADVSRFLRGRRIAPFDFFERMDAALDELTAEAVA